MNQTNVHTASINEIGTEAPGKWVFIINERIGHRGYFLKYAIIDRFGSKIWYLGTEEKLDSKTDEREIIIHIDGRDLNLESIRIQIFDVIESNWLALQMRRIMATLNVDAAEEEFLTKAALRIPFGKYIGAELRDVPLSYLDQTISVMPTTWFVRQVIEFVDVAMGKLTANGAGLKADGNISTKTYEEAWQALQ